MTRAFAWLPLALAALAAGCGRAPEGSVIDVWHGAHQRVGHLGDAQDDFNLLGCVFGPAPVKSLSWSLNGGPPAALAVGEGEFGFRRLAGAGHFNADIPVDSLLPGTNRVLLRAEDDRGRVTTQAVSVVKEDGSRPLPVRIRWVEVREPQDVVQMVDGRWLLTSNGIRTQHAGYDRVLLVGERTWQDYVAEVGVTVHRVSARTSRLSGGNGVGIIARFAGHVTGGPRSFPAAQPKWGYQPFGAIGWLRWKDGQPASPPEKQFYPGDSDRAADHGEFALQPGRTYRMKLACKTLPDRPGGAGVTRYNFRIWAAGAPEPSNWDWEETQVSAAALRRGGVALVAHHVDATFGDLSVDPW